MKRYNIELDGHPMVVYSSGEGSPGDDAGHSAYCVARNDVHRDCAAFRAICETVQGDSDIVDSVLELFGGSGWHSLFVQTTVKPNLHEVWERDKNCLLSIMDSLPDVKLKKRDSFASIRERSGPPFTWVHADFNQFTYNRHLKDKAYAGVLDGVFKNATTYVTLTDSSIFGNIRFAKNRQGYAQSIGMNPDDWSDYYRAVNERYQRDYGFGIVQVKTWDGMASMCLLKSTYTGAFEISAQRDRVTVKVTDSSDV